MEVIDINNEEEKIETLEIPKKKKENVFVRIKNFVVNLPKKTKIIIGIVTFLLILIVTLVLVLVVFKETEEEVFSEEPVVLAMDNYKYEDGILYFYDSEENELGTYTCLVKDETLCYLSLAGIDESLDKVIKIYSDKTEVVSYMSVYGDLVFVNDDESILLYNMADEAVVVEFSYVESAYSDYVIVSDLNGMYALVDLSEGYNLVTEFVYDYIGYSNENENFVFSKNGDFGIMNSSGKEIIDDISGSVVNYNSNHIISIVNSKYSLINYDNKKLLTGYDYIKVYEEYIYAFLSSELFIFDKNLNKLNEIGIEIEEITDYTDYSIYNSDYTFLSKDYAVEYELLSEKSLKVEGITFNVYEALINENIDFANYLSGVWYIYVDKEKTELIGSYTCEVENSVTSADSVYSSCYLASEIDLLEETNDKGYLPIINEKYVFIYDTKTLSLFDNIVLYDLSTDKILANYSSVDIISKSTYYSEITHDSNDTLILATNTDDELGLIQIDSSGASGLIDFSYASFEIFGDYYLLTDISGYRFLFTGDGECLNENSKIKNEITEYYNGYLLVSVSGKEQVYSLDGSIISDAYKNIMLEDSVYLTIDDENNIGIFKYTDNQTNYFAEEYDNTFSYLRFYQVDSYNVSVTLYTSEDTEIASYYVGIE